MEVRNCRGCGRLFNYLSGNSICPECREKLDKKFQAVKEYIRENPGSTINEISEQMEVPTSQIKQWVREERLQFSDSSPVGIECEKCGAMIKTGKYCKNCKETIANNLTDAFKRPERASVDNSNKSGDRMYFKR